jgi:dihydroorotate dehydrogenase subfamily 2
MKKFFSTGVGLVYRGLIKPVLFLRDPEWVHMKTTHLGERLGKSRLARNILASMFRADYPNLSQTISGTRFRTPIGLAAGFDYEARLTQVLPSLGFGFGTVGTLTNLSYKGNPRPMLGRLPKSKSLLVNKGFKNLGIAQTLARLRGSTFAYPVGVSIGKTNTAEITTQQSAAEDVVSSFKAAEHSGVPFAYYELNISCPNLVGSIDFYEPAHLEELLSAIGTVNLAHPVWIKMPIVKTDDEVRGMLDVITRHSFVTAVVFGNLQKDRQHPTLVQEEVARFSKGNFSGLPCRDRSDELIALGYKEYGTKLMIVGCGGVFSTEDAYRKITLGATLVELVTGLVFQGPQLVAEINHGIARKLSHDGCSSINDAIGSAIPYKE